MVMQDQPPNGDARHVFAALVDSVKDYAIFMLDPRGRVATWNTGARAIKGYTSEEIIGQPFTVFYSPEDVVAGKPRRLLDTAAREGRIEDEGWRVRKDGTRFWADVVITAVRDSGGELVGFIKVTRDLSERRRSEEALRTSEERTRLMIESVKDYAIFMLDPRGYITNWNSGAQRLKGYRADEIIGEHFSLFYPEEDITAGKPALELEIAAATGRFEDEGWRLRKDGSQFWANVIISSVRDGKGALIGFAKVTRDMTDRKRIEEELAQRARQQEAVAELGLFAVRTPAVEAILDKAVELVSRLLGTELTGVFLLEGHTPALRLTAGAGWHPRVVGRTRIELPPAAEHFVPTAQALEKVITEAHLPLTEGAKSSLSAALLSHQDAAPFGVFGAWSMNVTTFSQDAIHFLRSVANVIASAIAREQTREELREERQEKETAQRAVRERDVFLSVAAHELRTPLTVLQLKLQGVDRMLRKELGEKTSTTKAGTRLGDALRQTDRLAELVERLLDVSRMAAGRVELAVEEFDLGQLIGDVVKELRGHAGAAELRVEVSGDVTGRWDRRRIEQILVNLIANAIKYGEGKPIDISIEGSEDAIQITVADKGIGIPEQDLERIFNPFERAAPVEHYAGLGLGLFIARHLAEAHGGVVHAESSLGAGATFVVDLPRETAVDMDTQRAVNR